MKASAVRKGFAIHRPYLLVYPPNNSGGDNLTLFSGDVLLSSAQSRERWQDTVPDIASDTIPVRLHLDQQVLAVSSRYFLCREANDALSYLLAFLILSTLKGSRRLSQPFLERVFRCQLIGRRSLRCASLSCWRGIEATPEDWSSSNARPKVSVNEDEELST